MAYFCTVYLTTKFHHPTFNRTEVIVVTNKQKDTAENIHLALWLVKKNVSKMTGLKLGLSAGLKALTQSITRLPCITGRKL